MHEKLLTYAKDATFLLLFVCWYVCMILIMSVLLTEFQQQCTVIKEKDLVLKAKANMTLVNTLDAVDMGSHSDHKYLCFNTGKGEVKVNTDLYSASL